jgi:predicted DNA-binding protein
MTTPSQTPADRILWVLITRGGKADRSYLRRRLEMRLAELEPFLAVLESEKRIKRIDFEKNGKRNQEIVLA